MANLPREIETALENLNQAASRLRHLSAMHKNQILERLAQKLEQEETQILAANRKDLSALAADTTDAFRDRLVLNPRRLKAMAESLRQVAGLPDPVGEIVEERTLANGLNLKRVRAPLGVLFMIFESRPNVILEAFSLAFKAGNVILLRGGSESRFTSQLIYQIMRETMADLSLQPFFGMDDYNREWVSLLLKRKDKIDIVIPRGSETLIEFVQKNASMPVIKNDRGLCHAFVHRDADLNMSVKVVANAKTQRPGVCNSLETVLVHQDVAATFIPALYAATLGSNLKWRADETALKILGTSANVTAAKEVDWNTEHLDMILNCKVVPNLEAALHHIQCYGSKHSEVILTADPAAAQRFQNEVDAAAVYWNASTRFTDGFEFGLGGELGISTQKLHVRGPVGLRELTTPRWLIQGNGQVRE